MANFCNLSRLYFYFYLVLLEKTTKYILTIYFRNGTTFYPEGLGYLLNLVSSFYPGIPLYVNGIGCPIPTDDVRDELRVDWLRYHINEVLKCKTVVRIN